ncbi:MAG TPA: glycosyltransferase [Candidatus Kapabacteria bacterium]|nr:glycosyltransferase [Candidatus Kapabacteria bacterium]
MLFVAIISFVLLAYTYAGYPLLVRLWAKLAPRKWAMDDAYRPSVSIILSAYNEEMVVGRCTRSLLGLNYPEEKIEILCGSDGSSDSTNSILSAMAEEHPIIRPFLFSRRRGKMLVLNDLVAQARNEILLFVDADITLDPNSLLAFTKHFADSSIGAVAGRYVLLSPRRDGLFKSESAFLSFESNLRRNEALVHSTVGLNGANYAMRRSLWTPISNQHVHDDLFGVLQVIEQGKRVLYEEHAVAIENYGRTYRDEFLRKSRGSARGFQTLAAFPRLLFRGPVAWMIWPHKVLRFLTGYLAIAFLSSTILLYIQGTEWLRPIVAAEGVIFLLIAFGWLLRISRKSIPVISEIYWFFEMNLAFLWGTLQYVFRQNTPTWSQTSQVLTLTKVEEAIHS